MKIIVILLILKYKESIASKSKPECGYKQCPPTRDGALNVHIIPHSHMDAGWVKTFDQYYYGTKSTISTANVQLIYHSVISELLHDARRKFTLSEVAYFWRWWKEQRGTTRATVRSLVAEGRLQFAGGGWVQADETTVDYLQLLDQYTWGLRKINDTLGPCGTPTAAWQVDAYGHTREHASLLAQMGFDGLFIGRVDYKEREAMIEEDRMEFMWRGSDVLGKMSDIMSHALYNVYNSPDGFCFDILCNDEPVVDDPDTNAYNADVRVNDFISLVEKQAKYYAHDNIAVTMGGDFTYQSAASWFINIDKLINHVNTHPANMSDINIFYSSPACYMKAVYLYGKRDKALNTNKGDHVPYGSDKNTYWTGLYTSRPSLKYLAKRAHVFLQVVKQLSVLSRAGDSYELHLLRHAVSLVLHHDGITGTSQQHVTNDFIRMLSEAIDACSKKVSKFLSVLTPSWGGSRRPKNTQQFITCHQLNISQCRFTETQDSILLIVYNPLSVKTYHHIRLPAIGLHYSIRDFNDEEVEHQLVPLATAIINLPGRSSAAIQELCFEAENIPPLGFTAYSISTIRDQLAENQYAKKTVTPEEQEIVPSISNEYIKVTINETSGLLESIQTVDGVKIMVSQNWYFYSQMQNVQNSGAYSFRPGQDGPTLVTDKVVYHTIRGTLVKEIRQRFSDWISQVIRLYRGEEFVEIEWVVGPVPVGTDLGKEVVTIFKTNITNNGVFYTDSNGRQMMKRTCLNESAGGTSKRTLASCQYPVHRICIQNSRDGLCVLSDRSQAATSYNEGEIQLMVHRRLLTDDGFGLEESLNEEEFGLGLVVKGKHRIFVGNHKQEVDDLTFFERASQLSRRWTFEPWLFMTQGEKTRRKWQNIRNKRFTGIRLHGLPRHIHILTLEPWKGGSVLLRLENTLENYHGPNTDVNLSNPSHITVDLRKIFLFIITRVEETTLAANQWLQHARQMDWSTRYVYPGGDDGILPEDNPDYIDELKMIKQDDTENEQYSEENYPRKKSIQRNKVNQNEFNQNRKKRSSNTTENIYFTQNITDRHNKNKSFENTTFRNSTDFRKYQIKIPKINFLNLGRLEKNNGESEEDLPLRKRRNRKNRTGFNHKEEINSDSDEDVTKSIYDMYYKVKPKQYKQYLSSEEYSNYGKNRRNINYRKFISSRRAKYTDEVISRTTKREDISLEYSTRRQRIEDSHEATSSSKRLERHYKANRRNYQKKSYEPSSKTKIEDSEEFTTGRNGRKKNNGVTSRKLPFFNTKRLSRDKRKRRNREKFAERRESIDYDPQEDIHHDKSLKKRREYIETSQEEELSSPEVEDDEFDEDKYPDRRKRAITEQTEQSSEQNEQDYVITLRPTQIRTFIIWFEEKKPTYT